MALPICGTCAKGKVLCPSCEAKLAKRLISEFDVEVARVLYELFGDESDFTHAIDTESHIVIITKPQDVGKVIGKGGSNIRILSERLGKQVKIVGHDSFTEMVAAFVAPARVRGINTVYRPDGVKSFRIRIEREDKKRLRMGLEDMRKLISAVTDREVELAFD